ncbi:hypothetical protein Ancab_006627 [Ancistrocladus abbreviatus]
MLRALDVGETDVAFYLRIYRESGQRNMLQLSPSVVGVRIRFILEKMKPHESLYKADEPKEGEKQRGEKKSRGRTSNELCSKDADTAIRQAWADDMAVIGFRPIKTHAKCSVTHDAHGWAY